VHTGGKRVPGGALAWSDPGPRGREPQARPQGVWRRKAAGVHAPSPSPCGSAFPRAGLLQLPLLVLRVGLAVDEPAPAPLHQVYDDEDYRRVRFVGRQKEVNENFAIDLIAEQPVSQVGSRVISCDGGGGALGHPRVYINLDKETKTGTCGYCGLQFRQQHH
uniref:Uncharacterized protein n=1 Tax=Ovis aries TaxID=9940 RepID=A0AC11BF38_SHEEP